MDHLFQGAEDAFYTAVEKGQTEVARLLLDRGVDVNWEFTCGKTPLLVAIQWNQTEVAQLLLDRGANVNHGCYDGTPLHSAVEYHHEFIQILLDRGANVNAEGRNGRTPLHLATSYHPAQLLLQNGAIVNARDGEGLTPLYEASNFGETRTAQLLLLRIF